MQNTIKTIVSAYFSTHEGAEVVTQIMNIAIRDAAANPGLYKSINIGDELADLAKLILDLQRSSENPEFLCAKDLIRNIDEFGRSLNSYIVQKTTKDTGKPEELLPILRAATGSLGMLEGIIEIIDKNLEPGDWFSELEHVTAKLNKAMNL